MSASKFTAFVEYGFSEKGKKKHIVLIVSGQDSVLQVSPELLFFFPISDTSCRLSLFMLAITFL